jgi:hypothetical protein
MPNQQRDYILRLIEQLAVALRRLREELDAGGGEPAEVVRQTEELQSTLLGPLAGVLPRLDPVSAAQLLNDPRQVRFWAESLRVEALGRRRQGEEGRAGELESRAATLEQAADELEEGN